MYATQEAETLKVKLAEANALNDRLQKQVQRAEAAKDDAELERESLREGINKTARENRARPPAWPTSRRRTRVARKGKK